MANAQNIIAANPGASLETYLQACMQPSEMPKDYFPEWVACLQEVYNALPTQPILGDYAKAIYDVYTNPADPLTAPVDQRVTYEQLIKGLTLLQNVAGTGPAYVATDIPGVVDNYYMQIVITIDTAQLLAASGTSGPNPYDAGPYISMTDNHPAQSSYVGGYGCELNDQDLHPNMTIHWQAIAKDGTTPITLTEFEQRNGEWPLLASLPVSLTSNEYYSKANSSIPPNTTAIYAFNFAVAGSSITYWFDPYIGDNDE